MKKENKVAKNSKMLQITLILLRVNKIKSNYFFIYLSCKKKESSTNVVEEQIFSQVLNT